MKSRRPKLHHKGFEENHGGETTTEWGMERQSASPPWPGHELIAELPEVDGVLDGEVLPGHQLQVYLGAGGTRRRGGGLREPASSLWTLREFSLAPPTLNHNAHIKRELSRTRTAHIPPSHTTRLAVADVMHHSDREGADAAGSGFQLPIEGAQTEEGCHWWGETPTGPGTRSLPIAGGSTPRRVPPGLLACWLPPLLSTILKTEVSWRGFLGSEKTLGSPLAPSKPIAWRVRNGSPTPSQPIGPLGGAPDMPAFPSGGSGRPHAAPTPGAAEWSRCPMRDQSPAPATPKEPKVFENGLPSRRHKITDTLLLKTQDPPTQALG